MDERSIKPTDIIGIAGASGNVGGQVVKLLESRNIGRIVALARNPRFGVQGANPELIVRRIDYNDPDSLHSAFRGLDTLIFPGSDGDPEQMLLHHRNVLAAAEGCKVRRMIYLSSLDVGLDSPFPYAQAHRVTEEWLSNSQLEVCILRASVFTEFFLEEIVRPDLNREKLSLPAQSGRVSFVSKSDVAAALVGAVFEPTPASPLSLTGPEAIDFDLATSVVNRLLKRPLQYESVDEQAYRHRLSEQGYEPWLIEAFATMFSWSICRGHFEHVTPDVVQLTGSQPRTFQECIMPVLGDS